MPAAYQSIFIRHIRQDSLKEGKQKCHDKDQTEQQQNPEGTEKHINRASAMFLHHTGSCTQTAYIKQKQICPCKENDEPYGCTHIRCIAERSADRCVAKHDRKKVEYQSDQYFPDFSAPESRYTADKIYAGLFSSAFMGRRIDRPLQIVGGQIPVLRVDRRTALHDACHTSGRKFFLRHFPGQHDIQEYPCGIYIGAFAALAKTELFRCRIPLCPEQFRIRSGLCPVLAGYIEIYEPKPVLQVDHDIPRLDVPVNQAKLMRSSKCFTQLRHIVDGLFFRQYDPAVQDLFQADAFNVVLGHKNISVCTVFNPADAGNMRQLTAAQDFINIVPCRVDLSLYVQFSCICIAYHGYGLIFIQEFNKMYIHSCTPDCSLAYSCPSRGKTFQFMLLMLLYLQVKEVKKMAEEKSTDELMKLLRSKSHIADYLEGSRDDFVNESLSDYLGRILLERKLKKNDIISRAGIDRVYGYQILSGEKKNPSREKILCLAFGMQLSLEETQRALRLSGCSILYPRNRRDSIIIHALDHMESLPDCNEDLAQASEPGLDG